MTITDPQTAEPSAPSRTQIFLSYRRADSKGETGRLYDRLVDEFGADVVFMDVDDIPHGERFRDVIVAALGSSMAVCVIIGPEWASNPRLHEPGDYVHDEVLEALKANAFVLPVLLDDTPIDRKSLPKDLRRLFDINVVRLREDIFADDAERIIEILHRHVKPDSSLSARFARLRDRTSPKKVLTRVALTVVAFLAMFLGYERFLATSPVEPLSGDINVAVTEFGVRQPAGAVVTTAEMGSFARSVKDDIETQFETLEQRLAESDTDPNLTFDLIGPTEAGTLDQPDAAGRLRQAKDLAKGRDIHVVLYAVYDERTQLLNPEFFITADRLTVSDGELSGRFELGAPIPISGSLKQPITRDRTRRQLSPRVGHFPEIVLGLNYFGAGEYESARDVFTRLTGTVQPDDGLHLIHLFLANSYIRLDELDEAERWYQSALDLRPGYSRALIGLASVEFARANNGCEDRVNEDGVRRSVALFEDADVAAVRPVGAAVDSKIAFGKGRALQCLNQAGITSQWGDASALFFAVVDHDPNDPPDETLLAEAWVQIGNIEIQQPGVSPRSVNPLDAFNEAISLFELAQRRTGLNTTDRRATVNTTLGYTHCVVNEDLAAGNASFEAAIALATTVEERTLYQDQQSQYCSPG